MGLKYLDEPSAPAWSPPSDEARAAAWAPAQEAKRRMDANLTNYFGAKDPSLEAGYNRAMGDYYRTTSHPDFLANDLKPYGDQPRAAGSEPAAPAAWHPPENIVPWTPPAPEPESMASYWSRSPMNQRVQQVARAAVSLPVGAGREVAQGVMDAGEAAWNSPVRQNIGQGAELVGEGVSAVAGLPMAAGRAVGELPITQRAYGPYADAAREAGGYVNKGAEVLAGAALQVPAWWERNVTPPPLPPRSPDYGPPLSGQGSPPTATAPTGRPLTVDAAKDFLRQANGDKEIARQLARRAGYTF